MSDQIKILPADTPLAPDTRVPQTTEAKQADAWAQKEEDLKNRILSESVNEAREKFDPRTDLQGFIQEVSKIFINKKLDAFPEICEIARVQNHLKRQELEKTGYRGRFTGKTGFSKSGQDMWKYEIPKELYLFMTNLVYWDFWGKENKKIADSFMRRVCRGEDAMQLLMWVKTIYGANNQDVQITT